MQPTGSSASSGLCTLPPLMSPHCLVVALPRDGRWGLRPGIKGWQVQACACMRVSPIAMHTQCLEVGWQGRHGFQEGVLDDSQVLSHLEGWLRSWLRVKATLKCAKIGKARLSRSRILSLNPYPLTYCLA